METLSELHFNALCDIINIGTECAAQGLGEVIGEAVETSLPTVELVKLENTSTKTLLLESGQFGVVTQEFSGDLTGEVLMLFAEDDALRIVRSMMGTIIDLDVVREFENEAMCELGNIMINACLSSIADSLHIPIESSIPRYDIKSGDDIVGYIKADSSQGFVLASHVDISVEQHPIQGKLFFLINAISLSDVVDEIDQFISINKAM
jgi:chemotaxis protein CheC